MEKATSISGSISEPENELSNSEMSDTKVSLNAEEVQKLRLLLNINEKVRDKIPTNQIQGNVGFLIPKLPVTEKDLDMFVDSLMEGTQYSESFVKYNGKFKVTFRVRSRKDEEAVLFQMNEDFKSGLIHSDIAYYSRLNLYNLTLQTYSLDGVTQVLDYSKTLREIAETGIFGNMPEPKLYILISMLGQFEDKVSSMAREALTPDFSSPAIDT